MINTNMRLYSYSTIGANDAYGQPTVSEPVGEVKMAINILSQSVADNIMFNNATYIGLTQADVKDTYIIHYEGQELKVLYVNPKGRFKQVFMNVRH